ncbi:hypothetical protein [Paracoccus sp. ME4]|uniref:hypothetical protein n=1 Tax=Paracoccus sp. ME4 TaxID=3138066 RepID=UPI00398A6197
MADALRYVVGNRLGPDWATPALPENPTDEDRHLLAAYLCHRALRPQWRHVQFDMLMRGAIRCLPDQDWHGLEAPSVLAMRQMFEAAGMDGWIAVSGHVEGRRDVSEHAWLQHPDGRILDAFPPFGHMDPYVFIAGEAPEDHGYRATGIVDPACLSVALACEEGDVLASVSPTPRRHTECEKVADIGVF